MWEKNLVSISHIVFMEEFISSDLGKYWVLFYIDIALLNKCGWGFFFFVCFLLTLQKWGSLKQKHAHYLHYIKYTECFHGHTFISKIEMKNVFLHIQNSHF